VVNTQIGTSHADGSDSESSVILSRFYIQVLSIMCFQQRLIFFCFKKLDGCSVAMGDDRPCNMEGIASILIKMFGGMVRELKEVKYVPQLKKNFITVGALKVLDLEISGRDGVLKMIRGSMIGMKGVKSNNINYLK